MRSLPRSGGHRKRTLQVPFVGRAHAEGACVASYPAAIVRGDSDVRAGKIFRQNVGGIIPFAGHLRCADLAEADTMAGTAAVKNKCVATPLDFVPIALDRAPAECAIHSKAECVRGNCE